MQEKLRACQEEAETSEQALKARLRQVMEEVRSPNNDGDACVPSCCTSCYVLKCPPSLSSIS